MATPAEIERMKRLGLSPDGTPDKTGTNINAQVQMDPARAQRLGLDQASSASTSAVKPATPEQMDPARAARLGLTPTTSAPQINTNKTKAPKRQGLAQALAEELLLKPIEKPIAHIGQALGLVKPGPVNLPGVQQPVELPKTLAGKAGEALDFALTVGTLIPGLGEAALGVKLGRAAKAAETIAGLKEASVAAKALELPLVGGRAASEFVVPKALRGGVEKLAARAAEAATPEVVTQSTKLRRGASVLDQALPGLGKPIEKAAVEAAPAAEQILPGLTRVETLPGETAIKTAADKAAEKTRFFADLPKKIGKNAALGTAFSTGTALQQENAPLTDRLKTVALGTIGGAALPFIGEALALPFRGLYNSKLSQVLKNNSLYEHFLGESANVLKKMGPKGEELGNLIRLTEREAERIAAKKFAIIDKDWSKLNEKEQVALMDAFHASPKDSGHSLSQLVSKDKRMADAAEVWKRESGAIAQYAQANKYTIRKPVTIYDEAGKPIIKMIDEPWKPRRDYFPKRADTTKFTYSGLKNAAEKMVAEKKAPNTYEARKILDEYLSQHHQGRAGSLENARIAENLPNDFYLRKPRIILHDYLRETYRRFAEAEVFGKDNRVLTDIISQIEADGPQGKRNAELARQIYKRVFGLEGQDLAEPGILRLARSLQMPSLGLAAIPNAFQSVNTVVKTGLGNTIKGAIRWFTDKEGHDFAQKAAAITESTLRDLSPDLAGGNLEKFTRNLFKMTQFNRTEKWNRGIAANAGREYAMEWLQKLYANPLDKDAYRRIEELGFDMSKKFNDRRSIWISPIENKLDPRLEKAGQYISNSTQHRSSPLDLPLFYTSQYGRFITQFKNFPFKQAQFISNEVFKEAARGNFRPLLRFAVIGLAAGEVSADVKALARGDTKRWKSDAVHRLVDNLSAVGGIGLFSDTINSAASGQMSLLKMFAGPTIGDVADLGSASVKAILPAGPNTQDKTRDLKKFGTAQIPVIGPYIKNKLYPSP